MPTQPAQPFDDPALKAALKRAFGGEVAPAGLRQRVQAAMDASEGTGAAVSGGTPSLRLTEPMTREDVRVKPKQAFYRSPAFKLAIAAMVLVIVGVVAKQYLTGTKSEQPRLIATLPKPFAEAMVQTHDAAAAQLASAPAAVADLAAAQQSLSAQLGYPVLAPPLGADWAARHAEVATLNGVQTARVTYTRGDRSVSLYSIPANRVYSPPDGATYEMTEQGHAIAGFVRDKTMYCIVGDERVPMADLKQLSGALLGRRGS